MPIFSSSVNKKRDVDEENPYWISFSDIMSGLLIIFILATLQLLLELSEKNDDIDNAIKEIAKTNQVREEILDQIIKTLHKENIKVELDDNRAVLHIPEEVLSFRRGSHSIPENKKRIVNRVGEVLYEAIVAEDRYKLINTIFIEGHTDSEPANRIKMGNWGLSANRAIEVWDYWRLHEGYGEELSKLKNTQDELMFSVSGYAETRRINILELTKEDLRKNRRIDIRFTMRQPNIADLEKIQEIF